MEFNIKFIQGLKKEWKNICLTIKTQENFDSYFLSNLYNILKSHEVEVKEIAEEKDKVSFGGPLALVSYVKDDENEEGLIVNSDDEAVPYYSNNNVKNFYCNTYFP